MHLHHFNYGQVTDELIARLANMVAKGQSAVLLGARYSGKRYLLLQLANLLHGQGIQVISITDLLHGIKTESQFRQALRDALGSLASTLPVTLDAPLLADDTPLLADIDTLFTQHSETLTLMVANVDSIAHHIARRLLREVQARVKDKRLVVVMSGERDFSELVHGPDSGLQLCGAICPARICRRKICQNCFALY